MKWLPFLSAILFTIAVVSNSAVSEPAKNQPPRLLPEFTHSSAEYWINSAPLTIQNLLKSDKIILIDMWTFDCWNCYRSFPWLNALEKKYQDKGLQIIGIHTPEFDHEKIRANIEHKVKEFKLHHPIMIDNDFSYWRALNNRYWPSYYLVNQQGEIVYSHVGESHKGDRKAKQLEQALLALLK
jgi:thiol-disulfide isomerase/thioredoxin